MLTYGDAMHPSAVTHNSATGKNYTYDPNGNMTGRGSQILSWDFENRVESVTIGSSTTTMEYDYTGMRVKKWAPGASSPTQYPFTGYEIEPDGTITKFIKIGTETFASKKGSAKHFYHNDHLGGVNVISSEGTGTKEQLTEYDPWGSVSRNEGPTPGSPPTVDTTHRFTGQELDPETGLYYYGGRYYDHEISRFVSPDPYVQAPDEPQNLNRYSYVLNSPMDYTDPNGFFFDAFLGGMAAAPDVVEMEFVIEAVQPAAQSSSTTSKPDVDSVSRAAGLKSPSQQFDKSVADALSAQNERLTAARANSPFFRFSEPELFEGGGALGLGGGLGAMIRRGPGQGTVADYIKEVVSGKRPVNSAAAVAARDAGIAAKQAGQAQGKGVQPYQVGKTGELEKLSPPRDGLMIHHAGQKNPMAQVIPGYDPKNAPGIALPDMEHRRIPNLRGEYKGNPRGLLARDIKNLRTFTNAPNVRLKELIQLNKEMYPEAFAK